MLQENIFSTLHMPYLMTQLRNSVTGRRLVLLIKVYTITPSVQHCNSGLFCFFGKVSVLYRASEDFTHFGCMQQ